MEFEKRSRLSLTFWVIRKNIFSLWYKFALVAFALWFFFGGGVSCVTTKIMRSTSMTPQKQTSVEKQPEPPAADPVPVFTPPPGASRQDAEEAQALYAQAEETCCGRVRILLQEIELLEAAHAVEIEMLSDELDTAEQDLLRVYSVVLLTQDEVTFRNGYSYRVGELIDEGMYRGRTVESINWRRRTVVFDDGTKVRMGTFTRSPDAGGVPVDTTKAINGGT